MSHTHDQRHGHHHEHGHHSQSHEQGPLSPSAKLTKMIEHWLHHNEDHAQSFREWGQRAEQVGEREVSTILEQVAAQSLAQNQLLEKALELLKKEGGD